MSLSFGIKFSELIHKIPPNLILKRNNNGLGAVLHDTYNCTPVYNTAMSVSITNFHQNNTWIRRLFYTHQRSA